MIEAYSDVCAQGEHDYNLSTLVCLPKQSAGEYVEFGTCFKPSDTRPLSIMNCDSRMVASAFRYRWEQHLSGFILDRQQGCLRGRSIIQNLLEVDNTMFMRSLLDTDSAAISLEFAAAFPSVSQEYCHRLLQEYGLPPANSTRYVHCTINPGARHH